MLLHTILLHISNINSQCHVISNYFVGNSHFSIDFYRTVMTNPTLRSLDWINYLPHHILNSCYKFDLISLSSVVHIFILFKSLKVKIVFVIHGFEFRYIFPDEKFPSCIKYPQHEENSIVTVGFIGS